MRESLQLAQRIWERLGKECSINKDLIFKFITHSRRDSQGSPPFDSRVIQKGIDLRKITQFRRQESFIKRKVLVLEGDPATLSVELGQVRQKIRVYLLLQASTSKESGLVRKKLQEQELALKRGYIDGIACKVVTKGYPVIRLMMVSLSDDEENLKLFSKEEFVQDFFVIYDFLGKNAPYLCGVEDLRFRLFL